MLAYRQFYDRSARGAAFLQHLLAESHVLYARCGRNALAFEVAHRFVRAVLGDDKFVQYILGVARIGPDDLECSGLRELPDGDIGRTRAVGGSVRASRQHRFHYLLRARELESFDIETRFLEIALF